MLTNDAAPESRPGWGSSVDRPRLRAMLDEGEESTLTVVVAPAGWGKSVLLSDWVDSTKWSTAWISLAAPDNDPGRLLRTLYDGLSNSFGESSEGLSQRVDFLTSSAAPARAEELGLALEDGGTAVVVIDDVHVLRDPVSVEAMQRFVEAARANIRVILAARHDPPFPLARLRVSGGLTELRQSDLAFTVDEAVTLLDSSGISLEPDVLRTLVERTEGWGAGLRLAASSMRQSQEPARVVRELAGTDRLISEYLLEEVLRETDPDDLRFFLRTSILDEINEQLAEALTGRPDGQRILEHLVSEGFFTNRTASPGGFRYHHLFRGLLRSRLYEIDPAAVPELHLTAAEWLHEHGEPVEAIEHAIAAGDIENATAWLGASATGLVSFGQGQTVVDLSGRLIDSVGEPGALLLTTRLWALYNMGGEPVEVDRLFDTLIDVLEASVADADRPESVHGGDPRSFADPSALSWLRGLKARTHGDLEALVDLDDLAHLPSPSGRLEAWVGEGRLWTEHYERADELLAVYDEHAQLDQYAPSIVHALGLRAFALVGQGRFAEADVLIDQAISLIDRFGISHLVHTVYAQMAHGWVRFERGQLAEAEASFVASQENVERLDDVPVAAQHAMLRSRTRWSLNDRSGALALLDQSHVTRSGRVVSGHFAYRLDLERARLDLLAGTPQVAIARLLNWEIHLASAEEAPRDQLLVARIATAVGSLSEEDFDRVTSARTTGLLHRIEVAKLVAARSLADGDVERATESLVSAMQVAAKCGAIQRLIDERELFGPAFALAAEQSGLAETFTLANPAADAVRSLLVDPLTERELEVLEKLCTHLTYNQIADDLFVSPNTIKSHAKAIHRKLAVSRRADAVDRARDLGLIAR